MPRWAVGKLAVVNIGQLATLAGPKGPRIGSLMRELGLIENAALLIEDGRIAGCGSMAEVEPNIPAEAETFDAEGALVTPGLVDAHTHLVFCGNRAAEFELRIQGATYREIAESGGGILSTMRQVRQGSEHDLLEASKDHALRMLQCGTATAEAKSGYGLTVADELKMLRVAKRVREETALDTVGTFLGLHALPPEFADDAEGYARAVTEEMLPEVARQGLAEFCDAFFEEGFFSETVCRQVLMRAKELGLGLRLHGDQLRQSRGAQLAAELGAKTADHLEYTEDEGIEALARAGVQPVLLPASVYALGHELYPNARAMIESGLAVVLATDFNPGSSPTPSLPMAMSLACTQMRMTPAEALTACTINAAHSLNRGHDRGSLEAGKRADLVVWDAGDYREIPYWFGVERAIYVWTAGERAI